MLLIYFRYFYVEVPLRFCYNSTKAQLLYKFYSNPLILRYSYASMDNNVTEDLLIVDMICCNKIKCIEKSPLGVPIKKWYIAVQEYVDVLGQIGFNTDSTPRV